MLFALCLFAASVQLNSTALMLASIDYALSED